MKALEEVFAFPLNPEFSQHDDVQLRETEQDNDKSKNKTLWTTCI